MSDSTRKIKITSEPVEDSDNEISETPKTEEYDFEDDDREREPINLDSVGGLADALAAASRIKTPANGGATRPAATNGAGETKPVVEIVQDEPADPPMSEAAVDARLEQMRAEVKQANDNYLRALADLQNFRRRGEEERQRILLNGNEKLLKEVLPILDDLDLAVNHARQTESYEQLIGGVEAIQRKFRETLAKQGVEPIPSVGEKFDPDLHEAVMVEEGTDHEDETVTAELRKGYTLNKRVIRPSMVKVAKG